jgi:hypothetical protein
MKSFQPGLKFNTVNRAEILSRLQFTWQNSARDELEFQFKMELFRFFEEFKMLFMSII